MAWRRWGQPSPHNAPFRPTVSEVFMLLSLAPGTSLVSSSGYLSVPPSISYSLPCSLFAFYSSVFLSLSFSIRLFSFLQSEEPLFPLLFLNWNAKSQPDGSSHKFQASVTFWLGKRKRIYAWPMQQPSLPASGHVAAGEKKKFCLRTAEH